MKLAFSEASPDYRHYQFPYVVWAFPEPGETPADCMELGFAPSSPQLDRFVLCRHVRIQLPQYTASSENRRVLRKGESIEVNLIARSDYEVTDARRAMWKRYADQRFGEEVMSEARIDRLLRAPIVSHVLAYRDSQSGTEIGTALLFLQAPRVAYYYYAFYHLDHPVRSLGMFMMTWAVDHFASQGFRQLYLGTCYSENALYKTQFTGVEFFNGNRWSPDLDELKFLVRRQTAAPSAITHLLEDPDYLERFPNGESNALATHGQFRILPRDD